MRWLLHRSSAQHIIGVQLERTTMQERRKWAALCGKYCGDCPELSRGCLGCAYQLGLPLDTECKVFHCCAVERGLEHCGLCPDFPCQTFLSLDSALQSARRYRALTRRAEIGTDAWLEESARDDDQSRFLSGSES